MFANGEFYVNNENRYLRITWVFADKVLPLGQVKVVELNANTGGGMRIGDSEEARLIAEILRADDERRRALVVAIRLALASVQGRGRDELHACDRRPSDPA